jgi:hypothetical protein
MHPAYVGKDHLVLADMGCRNTVFNATAQSGLPFLPEFAAAGVGCFRQALQALAGLLQGNGSSGCNEAATAWWIVTRPSIRLMTSTMLACLQGGAG